MLKRRILKLTIAAIAVFGSAGGLATIAVAPASASNQRATASSVAGAPSIPSTSDRCVNKSHTASCWALTLYQTTLYLRGGGTKSIGGNDLVLIQCYYISGGTVWDHVSKENAGGWAYVGHINDNAIDLNGYRPWNLQYPPNIPGC